VYETEYGFVIILIEDSVADDSFLTKRSIYECVIISSAVVMRIQCMLRPQLLHVRLIKSEYRKSVVYISLFQYYRTLGQA